MVEIEPNFMDWKTTSDGRTIHVNLEPESVGIGLDLAIRNAIGAAYANRNAIDGANIIAQLSDKQMREIELMVFREYESHVHAS